MTHNNTNKMAIEPRKLEHFKTRLENNPFYRAGRAY